MRYTSICRLAAAFAVLVGIAYLSSRFWLSGWFGPEQWLDEHRNLARTLGIALLVLGVCFFQAGFIANNQFQIGAAAVFSIVTIGLAAWLVWGTLSGGLAEKIGASEALIQTAAAPDSAQALPPVLQALAAFPPPILADPVAGPLIGAATICFGLLAVIWGLWAMPGPKPQRYRRRLRSSYH